MGRHSEKSRSPLSKSNVSGAPKRPQTRSSSARRLDNQEIKNVTRSSTDVRSAQLAETGSRRRGSLETAPARLKAERDRRKRRNRRIALISGLGVLALIGAVVLGGIVYLKVLENGLQKGISKKAKLNLELTKADPQEPYNMLIMGFDKRKADTQYRTDTMILARVDPKLKKVWMLSLPRDYKVQIPGHGTGKLNSAYAYGEEKLAIKTIEKLTGQTINHFMAVNFTGFSKAVDAMGGVYVDVPSKINDPKADYSPGKKASKIDAGPQILDGAHALTFVRSRAYADADFSRMKSQQIFFKAVADQMASKVPASKLPSIVTSVVPYLATDMSLMTLLRTAQDLKGAGSKNIYTETLPGSWVSPYIQPDEEKKAAMLAKFEQGLPFKTPKKKAVAADGSTADGSTGGQPAKPAIVPSAVKVTVRNGTTKAGVAKQASSVLKARGFSVGEVGNTANQSVYEKTLVIYKTSKESATLVAKYMPAGVTLVESRGMYSYDSEILLVIGKDWDIAKLPVADVKTQ